MYFQKVDIHHLDISDDVTTRVIGSSLICWGFTALTWRDNVPPEESPHTRQRIQRGFIEMDGDPDPFRAKNLLKGIKCVFVAPGVSAPGADQTTLLFLAAPLADPPVQPFAPL